MIKEDDGSQWKGSTRGEAAWKETREGVAARNAEARKAGKQRREAYERERASAQPPPRVEDPLRVRRAPTAGR